ncbi:MAG: DUF5110 domain-containing protein [Clostridiales bacterium]|jgi:alpha-D-xyloside xylohydrolase|nr:DUF5110 domain-containing protein [Clostridiales bacterium]
MLVVDKRPSRKIVKVERIQDTLILFSGYGTIKLEPKSPEIIRVVFTLEDIFAEWEKPGVLVKEKYDGWDYEVTGEEIHLRTAKIDLCINKETASFKYYGPNGELLLKERSQESKALEGFDSFRTEVVDGTKIERVVTPDGIKEVVKGAEKVFDRKLYKTRLYLEWQESEALYGLGQQEEGYLNLRGTTAYLHQANMKIAIPMLVSNLGYGILVDTYSPMIFNDTNFGSYFFTEADYEMDFYFIYGADMDGVIGGYRYLTGKASMLPKWVYGFVQSQERYETAGELVEVVKGHRLRGIGLDCIVLDWHYWEGSLWGQKSFDPARFPDPANMMKELHSLNVNLMISVWPNMSKDCGNYKEFEKKGLLFQASSIYNPFESAGRGMYWSQANEGLFSHGVDAWWCDSCEPFTPEWNHIGKPEAVTMYQEFYETSSQYIPAQYTNAYGLYHAQAMYEGQREITSEKRVVNLMRSGYTGQQRYGAILWSGDISADWVTLKRQVTAGLNLCASGVPYWSLDIGAFFVKKGKQWFWNGGYEEGYDDLGYKELFTRWYQFGCFLPMFRSHGTDFRRELWKFGDEGNVFYDALIKMNRLRYKLIPYIYSIAARVWKNDYTMLRMLAFDFPGDLEALDKGSQFMFGDCLMVCPVTEAMYYEKDSMPLETPKLWPVYLPGGVGWYDFWTNQFYEGGQTIMADATLDKIPIYVKEGGIIPMAPFMNYVDEISDAPITVRVYTGRDAEFEIYEDEGDGYQYEAGQFAVTKLTWSEGLRKLDIGEPVGSYPGMQIKKYNTQIINKV